MLSTISTSQHQEGSSTFHLNSSLIASQQPQYPQSYGGGVLFPWRLHEMLEAADTRGFSSVVSWLPDQKSFRVHDKETFVSLIMGQYFEQTKFKSFQRQLNMWGFERLLSGPEKGGYTHPLLVRGKPSLCIRMNRLKKKSTAQSTKPNATPTNTKSNNVIVDEIPQTDSSSSATGCPSKTALNSAVSVVSHHDDEVTCSADSEVGEEELITRLESENAYPAIQIQFDITIPEKSAEGDTEMSLADELMKESFNQGFEEFEGRFFFPVGDDCLDNVL